MQSTSILLSEEQNNNSHSSSESYSSSSDSNPDNRVIKKKERENKIKPFEETEPVDIKNFIPKKVSSRKINDKKIQKIQ